ncbi:MAG: sensor histidine kinase, partial [Verrucomicrobiota bacterium]
ATCVAPDAQGGVWIGTYRGGLHHWQDGKFTAIHARDGLASETIRSLLVDSRGDLWIGFEAPIRVQRWHAGRLQLFPLPVNSRPVRAWAEDPAGVVWMGTTDGRLFRAVGDALLEETSHTLQPSQPIRALHATADGSLWIGYAGAGVGRFKDGKFVRINSEAGLFDDYICGIMPDDLGRVWFTCNRGIFQVSQKELEAVADGRLERVRSMAFGRDESLPNLQATFGYWPGFVRSRDGRIWFPMRTGLAVVNAGGVRPNRLPPPVVIESALLDGRTFMPAKGELFVREDPSSSRGQERYDGRKNSIAPDHRKLEFRFTALTFIASESVYFRYRLEGYDDDWIDAGTKRSADYPRLPAGDYRFQVSACNSDGRWNPSGVELPFTVRAFFWNRWWFRLAAAIFFTAMIAGVVRYASFRRLRTRLQLLEQETALQKDRARIAQDLHDDLGANLTQIALLSELTQNDLDKPTQARGHVDQIFRTARTLTRSLDEIVWSVNPKNDTLDRFVSHLCTYAPDFLRSAGVRCRLDVPVEVPAAPLSPDVRHHLHLAVKETLHNVAKHAGASEVRLALQFAPDKLTVTVSDNGQGFRSEKELSPEADGLANIKQRMSAIGGRLEQHSEPGIGTVTTFVVPLGKVTA